jgi:hypothetical protein
MARYSPGLFCFAIDSLKQIGYSGPAPQGVEWDRSLKISSSARSKQQSAKNESDLRPSAESWVDWVSLGEIG